jgi:hypothetical protein
MFEIAAKVGFGDFLLYVAAIWIFFSNLDLDTIFTKLFSKVISFSQKFLMFLPACEIHWALHFVLTFFTFRAEARPISLARQIGWRRSFRDVSRHLGHPSSLRALVA